MKPTLHSLFLGEGGKRSGELTSKWPAVELSATRHLEAEELKLLQGSTSCLIWFQDSFWEP